MLTLKDWGLFCDGAVQFFLDSPFSFCFLVAHGGVN